MTVELTTELQTNSFLSSHEIIKCPDKDESKVNIILIRKKTAYVLSIHLIAFDYAKQLCYNSTK